MAVATAHQDGPQGARGTCVADRMAASGHGAALAVQKRPERQPDAARNALQESSDDRGGMCQLLLSPTRSATSTSP